MDSVWIPPKVDRRDKDLVQVIYIGRNSRKHRREVGKVRKEEARASRGHVLRVGYYSVDTWGLPVLGAPSETTRNMPEVNV